MTKGFQGRGTEWDSQLLKFFGFHFFSVNYLQIRISRPRKPFVKFYKKIIIFLKSACLHRKNQIEIIWLLLIAITLLFSLIPNMHEHLSSYQYFWVPALTPLVRVLNKIFFSSIKKRELTIASICFYYKCNIRKGFE